MTSKNHWGTFKSSLVRWDIEFPASTWRRWGELLKFANAVFELGEREEVFRVDQIPPASARDHALFGGATPTARVSVFGPSGAIEDRVVADLGKELAALRPELEAVPHTPAIVIDGPVSVDRTMPVYVTISLQTDIWFSRVVGIFDDSDDDDGDPRWYDNSPLAAQHTPRLNRFLAGVRAAAQALGASWSHECGSNASYAAMVDDTGIRLELTATPIDWEHTGDGEIPYRATVGGQTLTIRVNDFPAEPLYTLIVDGNDLEDLDDWPAVWNKPPMPQHLLDMVEKSKKN